MMRAPTILALLMGGILAIGLLLVLKENVQVAPWAEHGGEGRLHSQTKNVSRLGGDVAAVRSAVARALAYDGSSPASTAGDWRAQVAAASGWNPRPRHIVALPAEGNDAALWALPGAYWAAFAGSPVVFVGRSVPGAEAEAFLRRVRLPVYVLAPEALVSDEVVERLSTSTPAVRIAGSNLERHAVTIAEFRDPATEFGWGRTHEDLPTWLHFVMAAPSDAAQAFAALPLARTVAGAFLFANDRGGIPAATDRYW
jgi:hypothetical protein